MAFQFAEEVFKVYAEDRVQRRVLELNTNLSFKVFAQLDEELLSVFKAFSLDRVQQQRVEVRDLASTVPLARPSERPPFPPERVAERLARLDALLAQVSVDEEEEEEEASEEEEVMEDMDLEAQPSLPS